MELKQYIKEAIQTAPEEVKGLTAMILDCKEDKTITDCLKGEFTLLDKTYVIYYMHNIFMYGEKGDTVMMSEVEFIKSLTPQQMYALAQLGLNPQPADKVQEFLNNADIL